MTLVMRVCGEKGWFVRSSGLYSDRQACKINKQEMTCVYTDIEST